MHSRNKALLFALGALTGCISGTHGGIGPALHGEARAFRSTAPVNCLAVSPNGGFVALCLTDGIRIASSVDRQPVAEWVPSRKVTALAFASDDCLVYSTEDGSVAAFDLPQNRKRELSGPHTGWIHELRPLTPSTFLSAGSDGLTRLWDSRSGFIRNVASHPCPVLATALMDYDRVASIDRDGTLQVLDVSKPGLTLSLAIGQSQITAACFLTQNELVIGTTLGDLSIVDLEQKATRPLTSVEGSIVALESRGNNTTVVSTKSLSQYVISRDSFAVTTCAVPGVPILSVGLSRSGDRTYLGCASGAVLEFRGGALARESRLCLPWASALVTNGRVFCVNTAGVAMELQATNIPCEPTVVQLVEGWVTCARWKASGHCLTVTADRRIHLSAFGSAPSTIATGHVPEDCTPIEILGDFRIACVRAGSRELILLDKSGAVVHESGVRLGPIYAHDTSPEGDLAILDEHGKLLVLSKTIWTSIEASGATWVLFMRAPRRLAWGGGGNSFLWAFEECGPPVRFWISDDSRILGADPRTSILITSSDRTLSVQDEFSGEVVADVPALRKASQCFVLAPGMFIALYENGELVHAAIEICRKSALPMTKADARAAVSRIEGAISSAVAKLGSDELQGRDSAEEGLRRLGWLVRFVVSARWAEFDGEVRNRLMRAMQQYGDREELEIVFGLARALRLSGEKPENMGGLWKFLSSTLDY